jgi:hypothetical protein
MLPADEAGVGLRVSTNIMHDLKRRLPMFARILEFTPKMEKTDEIVNVAKNEILPILKSQSGFL